MTKITRDQWNVIASRYAQGESISNIAKTYDCTAPAIHYILKQAGRAGADTSRQPARPAMLPVVPGVNGMAARLPSLVSPVRPAAIAEIPRPAPIERRPAAIAEIPWPAPGVKSSALRANLDDELRGAAASAIAEFLLNFDAALAEPTRESYQQLRQSAAELMRVAARTTIVVDRVSAEAPQAPLPRAEVHSSLGR
jgi:hypothetical protein